MHMSDVSTQSAAGETAPGRAFDAVVVGAGFAGLYMLHRLRGLGLSALVLEAGGGVGGTWFWNRYPGARCDIESLAYSYSFSDELQQEWVWAERYPSQPEILRYLNHVADRFDLRRDIELDTRVTSAVFDEATDRWQVRTDTGQQVSAKYCIMATGCLSTPHVPDLPGIDAFEGRAFHTGRWPDEVIDFSGERVGVIGTASTAIQVIPEVAEQAAHLFVFQRRPSFSMPAQNAPLAPDVQRQMKASYPEQRQLARESIFGAVLTVSEVSQKSALEVSPEDRQREYEARWAEGGLSIYGAFADLFFNKDANDTAADFVRAKIRETVHDPETARLLTPTDYPFAAKRLCVDTDYYATFNRDNVTLVDVKAAPIEEITPHGLRTRDAAYDLDSIIFATGFDAMTGALTSIDIRGRGGITLREKWADGPQTYLGVATAGFPNLFMITGPGSPSVLSNMVVSIEQHVDWIADCIDYLGRHEARRIEPTTEAEQAWVAHVNEVGNFTLFPRAGSWYTGANIPGKPRVFMPYIGGVGAFRSKCDDVAAKDYEGFAVTA
jgi:cation diffusion facilitator CzcD-associated flavoprotein CzcO